MTGRSRFALSTSSRPETIRRYRLSNCAAMLEATFIGHQGWLLSSSRTRILIDPLLTDGFGHGGLAGQVFPRRRLDLKALGEIDAVVVTHEHDDHFDIPSLLLLDRRLPVLISCRSSVAMREVLAELGFQVKLLRPDTSTAVGDLSYRTFVADHRSSPLADEWDVFPFVVTDAAGQGAFASSVDVPMPETMVAALGSTPGWPGVLCLANNTTDTRFVQRGTERLEPSDDTDALASVLRRRWQALARRSGAPRFTAITGGGWSHPADQAWIDHVAFSVDSKTLAHELERSCAASVAAVQPGDVIRLGATEVEFDQARFVAADPGSSRPRPRTVVAPTDFSPACGRTRLVAPQDGRLEAGLRDLARFWFGGPLFAAVHSMSGATSIGFVLRDEVGSMTYAYAPETTGFRRVDAADPFASFDSGFECWATDLVALFDGAIGPSALCYTGRLRCWNHHPDRLRVSPHELWRFAHPLHRPDAARRLYRRLAAVASLER